MQGCLAALNSESLRLSFTPSSTPSSSLPAHSSTRWTRTRTLTSLPRSPLCSNSSQDSRTGAPRSKRSPRAPESCSRCGTSTTVCRRSAEVWLSTLKRRSEQFVRREPWKSNASWTWFTFESDRPSTTNESATSLWRTLTRWLTPKWQKRETN